MNVMRPYVHQIWLLDDLGCPRERRQVIRTKKAFRQAMVRHFFEEDGGPIGFHLVDSPSHTFYRVHPFINRLGKLSVCFTALAKKSPNVLRGPEAQA